LGIDCKNHLSNKFRNFLRETHQAPLPQHCSSVTGIKSLLPRVLGNPASLLAAQVPE